MNSFIDGTSGTIFCCGQIGSGKTHTLYGPQGLVQHAIQHIFESGAPTVNLSFVRVYQDQIFDLLNEERSLIL